MQNLEEKIKLFNSNNSPLTKEELKSISGFENYSEENLQEALFSINTFCELLNEILIQIQPQEGKKSGIEITLNLEEKQVA